MQTTFMHMYCTSNAFSVPSHTEEVSISDASDTYVKVDIEEGMCEDEVHFVWMVFHAHH